LQKLERRDAVIHIRKGFAVHHLGRINDAVDCHFCHLGRINDEVDCHFCHLRQEQDGFGKEGYVATKY